MSAQCVLTREHVFEVNSLAAAAVIITVRFFSFAICWTADATGVTGRSTMASTPKSYSLPGQARGYVRLILGVAMHDLDRLTKNRAAEIGRRHLRREHRA